MRGGAVEGQHGGQDDGMRLGVREVVAAAEHVADLVMQPAARRREGDGREVGRVERALAPGKSGRVGHDLRYAIDPTVLRSELGWQPKHVDFDEGLQATIDWYRDNESWWRPLKDAVESTCEKRGQ